MNEIYFLIQASYVGEPVSLYGNQDVRNVSNFPYLFSSGVSTGEKTRDSESQDQYWKSVPRCFFVRQSCTIN